MKKQISLIFYIVSFCLVFVANKSLFAKDIYPIKCSTVVGTSSVEGVSEKFARQMAIKNALKNASMHNNLKISSSLELNNFSLKKDITRFTTQSKVSSFKIINEGMQELSFKKQFDSSGMPLKNIQPTSYQVTMDICLTENPATCDNILGNYLQPKIVVAQVLLADSYGARDIANLRSGYQLELKRRLQNKGYNNIDLLHSGSHLQDARQILLPNLDRKTLDPIINNTGAQYLLLNVIRTVSRHNEEHGLWTDVKKFYNQEIKPDARYLEVESFMVDLSAAQVVYQKKHGFDIKGDVSVGLNRPFGSNSFFATDVGMVFSAMLEQSSADIYQFLQCKSLQSNIIDIRDDEYILFLSAKSGAKVGDQLTVYHKFGRQVIRSGINLGTDSKPVGFLKITRIKAKFAVAEVISKNGLIQVGDQVRSW